MFVELFQRQVQFAGNSEEKVLSPPRTAHAARVLGAWIRLQVATEHFYEGACDVAGRL